MAGEVGQIGSQRGYGLERHVCVWTSRWVLLWLSSQCPSQAHTSSLLTLHSPPQKYRLPPPLSAVVTGLVVSESCFPTCSCRIDRWCFLSPSWLQKPCHISVSFKSLIIISKTPESYKIVNMGNHSIVVVLVPSPVSSLISKMSYGKSSKDFCLHLAPTSQCDLNTLTEWE